MATLTNYANQAPSSLSRVERVTEVLRWTYGLVPIVAGADKFMHVLTDWNKYLAPVVTKVVPLSADTFMSIVGVIEIIAGIIVLAKPKLGSVVVGFWLIGIAVNLVMTGQYYDVAVRDLVMAIGAFLFHTLLNSRESNTH